MASARVLRLAGAAALIAAALPMAASTPAGASWPGTNGDIFAASGNGNQSTIARFRPDGDPAGSVGSNLTTFSSFSIDAEGRRLVYSKAGEIWMVDLGSMEESQITEGPASERDPTFSYDGRYLIYVGEGGGDSEIYMWDLTDPAMGPINLTDNDVDDWAPAFANDGTGHGDLIAYVSLEGGTDADIWTMTPGGTDKTNLTNNSVDDFGPNWHPSFDMLAYSSRDAANRDQIFTMSWDGTGKDQLTSDANYNYEPAWSPDGTKIAFTKQGTQVGAVPRIFVRSGSPGGTETPLTPVGETGYDRAEWQTFPGGCEPDCGREPIKPTLVISLKKHVVVSGSAIGDGGPGAAGGTCGVGTPIQIQRYSKGQFRTIATATTSESGTFSKKVPDRTGRYRLKSTEYTDEANGTTCLASTSPAKVHRH